MSAVDDPTVTVLVPAAGSGRRMGGQRKQFRTLGGRSLLVQTLAVFDAHPGVDHLVVAAPAAAALELEKELRGEGLAKLHAVVAGGATRQASVGRALAAAPDGTAIVLVHDAVRPFVQPDDVAAVVAAVREHGAAALAVEAADTMRRSTAGRFGATVDRAGLYRMQTPQGFRRDLFAEAHAAAERDGVEATDDVDLVQRLGHAVHLVPGSTRNFKVTTPADWDLARIVWPHWRADAPA